MTSYKPHKDDLSRNYDLNFHDNFNNWIILPNVNDTTNSGAKTTKATIANQQHQDYYDQLDQQYIAYKYNGGLEQVTLELVPNIILIEKEDGFHQ